MLSDTAIQELIEKVRLDIDLAGARELLQRVTRAFTGLDEAQRNIALLLLEREILNPNGGHTTSLKFGTSDAINNPDCIVCRRPVRREPGDVSLRIISRWENTQLWITWHIACVDTEIELEYNMLDGTVTSSVGLI